jgi:hypothetical protein
LTFFTIFGLYHALLEYPEVLVAFPLMLLVVVKFRDVLVLYAELGSGLIDDPVWDALLLNFIFLITNTQYTV